MCVRLDLGVFQSLLFSRLFGIRKPKRCVYSFLHKCKHISTLFFGVIYIYIYIYISLFPLHIPLGSPMSKEFWVLQFVFNFSIDNLKHKTTFLHIYIYICIYVYMLWCYYLGQVWPFEVLLSGPSLFFANHGLSKNTIKQGFQHCFLVDKKLRAQI